MLWSLQQLGYNIRESGQLRPRYSGGTPSLLVFHLGMADGIKQTKPHIYFTTAHHCVIKILMVCFTQDTCNLSMNLPCYILSSPPIFTHILFGAKKLYVSRKLGNCFFFSTEHIGAKTRDEYSIIMMKPLMATSIARSPPYCGHFAISHSTFSISISCIIQPPT